MNAVIINFLILFLGFILNLTWEVGHSLLYAWNPVISDYIPHILFMSLKDAIVVLCIYWLVALALQKTDWIFDADIKDYLFAAFLGLMYAFGIEFHALQTGRWQYNELMPMLPIVNIGITPLLQMTILPSAIFYITLKKFWPSQLK